MSEILVSIITPCYNSEKTIEKTLQSIESQTYKNIEYIIIDGASTDSTINIIDSHRLKLPSNLKLISEKDGGIYEAMNKGIGLASGELIGIVNSDDWYENDTVEQVVNAFKGNKYEVIYGMQRNYLNGKEKTTFIHHHDFLTQQMITHPTCFVTRETYNDLGVFDIKYRSAADYDLMLRFWKSYKVTFTPIMKILSNFQLGGISSSQIGVRENAMIRYKNGYMSKKKYYFVVIKSHIYEALHKHN
jgi:glycosyltransferase involved in cell wall biosynthesis